MDERACEAVLASIVGEPHPGDDEGPFTGTLWRRGRAYMRWIALCTHRGSYNPDID